MSGVYKEVGGWEGWQGWGLVGWVGSQRRITAFIRTQTVMLCLRKQQKQAQSTR